MLFQPAAIAQEPDLSLLLSDLERWVGDTGSILLTYEMQTSDGRGAGRRTIGLDPQSGAWFIADHALGASGRTPDGNSFQANQSESRGILFIGDNSGPAQSTMSSGQQAQHISKGVDEYLPVALLINLRESSVGLRSIKKDEQGRWIIAHEGPTADPNVKRVTFVTFGADGTPRHYHADADPSTGREEIDFDYEIEPESPPGLAIAKQRQIGLVALAPMLVNIQYYPDRRPELFTMAAAQELATDNRIRTHLRLAQLAAPNDGSINSSAAAPYVRSRLDRAGWPLIVTGIVVVGLGLFALIRSRSGK